MLQTPPLHLCIILGKDSKGTFDSPNYKKNMEGNSLDVAIEKLRMAGYLLNAFTCEQMYRNGMGFRTFRFDEEYSKDTLSKVEKASVFRSQIKIHLIRSEKTVQELRHPDLAQQNKNAKNGGGLFGIAMDAIRKHGAPFTKDYAPIHAACIFIDTHWDTKLQLITGHAALGGGDNEIKLAIFGSHGLHSWPSTLEDVVPSCLDTTPIDTNQVANDCGECGTAWECLTVTAGAFMHEIGHLLGCPHQPFGIMLRDYVTLNRSFVTKEAHCSRTNRNGICPVTQQDECTWHRLDIVRFRYHPGFALPGDYPNLLLKGPSSKVAVTPVVNGLALTAASGIYLIEIHIDGKAQAWIEYLPRNAGGPGPQTEVLLSEKDIHERLPPQYKNTTKKISLHLLSIGGSTEIDNFTESINNSTVTGDFGLGKNQQITAFKSALAGGKPANKDPIASFDVSTIGAVRVYHGGALDGIQFYRRSRHSKFDNRDSVLFGKVKPHYTDITLDSNEIITGFNIRCGLWVDAIQIILSSGRVTPFYGGNGGGVVSLMVPRGYKLLGVYGNVGSWVDSIGIAYANY